MTVKHISDMDEFKALLASEKPVVVDFSAQWCGPCKFIAPMFEKLSAEYEASIVFAKVDVDEADDVAADQNIEAMPTFKFYKNGAPVEVMMGADLKQLTTLLKKYTPA